MKTPKTLVTTLLLTSLLLIAGCSLIPRNQRLDNSQALLQDPEVRAMVADHPSAAKKVFRVITALERKVEEK